MDSAFTFRGWEVDVINLRKILNLDLQNINATSPIEINLNLPNVKVSFFFYFVMSSGKGVEFNLVEVAPIVNYANTITSPRLNKYCRIFPIIVFQQN